MTQSKPKKRRGKILRGCLLVLLCLVLAAAFVVIGVPMLETAHAEQKASGSDQWMGELRDDLRLNEIIIPGAHDCGTRYAQLAFITNCQALNVAEQLEAGVRYLDIRLGIESPDGDGARKLKLMHGFMNCRTGPMPWSDTLYLDEVLEQCFAFLKAHPSETIIFAVKYEHVSEPVAAFQTLLDEALHRDEARCLLTDSLPTLGEARGKLVLMRRYADEAGLGARAGIPLLWKDQKGREDPTRHVEMTDNGTYRLWVQDRFEYGSEDKWNAFLAGLREASIAPEDLSIHFLSTKGTLKYGHPYAHAKKLNERLVNELPAEELRGWIILDFIDAPLAEYIRSANFR